MKEHMKVSINDGITTIATLNIATLDIMQALKYEVRTWATAHGFRYSLNNIDNMIKSLRKYNIVALLNEFACFTIEITE